ncbi:MAG: peptide ABC transporter substrate-binding protein [Planctomycetes bacterium]|nr:peptide ABC transporter substrate-binding protein [Planctomycetota bacterium]
MLKLSIPILLLIALLIGANLADRPLPRADFVAVNNGDVSTLDFTQMSWLQDFRAARLLFEGLTRSDVFSRSYDTIPAVAESWDMSPDGREYTFHIRRDARWSNGSPVTAENFRASWRRMLLPDNGADYAKLFRLIEGADEFYRWRAAALKDFAATAAGMDSKARAAAAEALWRETLRRFDTAVSLRAPDARTLRVVLTRPTPYFLSLTAFPAFFPVYSPDLAERERVDPATAQVHTDAAWFKPPLLTCNGPFTLERWVFKRDMRFRRNPHYWDSANIALDTISMPTIDNGNAAVLAFGTGSVNWVSDVTTGYRSDMLDAKGRFYAQHREQVESLRSQGLDPVEIDRQLPPDPRANIHAFPAFGTYFYNFNCRASLTDGRPNPFADARVRRAFTMAMNKEALVSVIRRSGEPAATSLVPPGSIAGYTPPRGLPFDPAAARELLAQAGYADPKSFPTVELLFNSDGGHDVIAQSVAKDWEQNLGVSVSLSQKEVRVFREQVKSGNFMVSRGTWFGDYGDPTTFLDISRAGDGNNDRGYANDEFERLMVDAENEREPAARLSILGKAEELLMERDVPMAPIFHFVQIYLFDAHKITGISPHPRQEQCLYLVDVYGDAKGSDTPKRMHEAPR